MFTPLLRLLPTLQLLLATPTSSPPVPLTPPDAAVEDAVPEWAVLTLADIEERCFGDCKSVSDIPDMWLCHEPDGNEVYTNVYPDKVELARYKATALLLKSRTSSTSAGQPLQPVELDKEEPVAPGITL